MSINSLSCTCIQKWFHLVFIGLYGGQALKILAKSTQPAVTTKITYILQAEMKTIHIRCQCSIKQLEGVAHW